MKQIVALVGLDDLDHVRRRGVLEQRRGRAEAQREDRQPAEPEGEGERRRADEHVVGRDAEHLLRVAVGDDQQVAMEVHRRLRLAGRAGGEAEQRDVVAAGRHRLEAHRLVERDAVELGVVVGGAVEADHLLRKRLSLAQATSSSISRVSQSASAISALSTILRELAGAQHRHGVDHDRAGLGRGQPAGDHRRVVGRADQHAVARLDAVVLDQRVRQPVGPVGELLVGAPAAVADQRGVVAEALAPPSGRSARPRR